MQLLVINLYELGQFLRILLWIFLPVFTVAALITTYVHYRKRRKNNGQDDPVMGVYTEGDLLAMPADTGEAMRSLPENTSEAYKGLLWLKNKYEQDREQATARFVQLKEEHRLLREKYENLQDKFRKKGAGDPNAPESTPLPANPLPPTREDLIELAAVKDQLAEKNLQLAFLQNQLDQRINSYHQLEQQDREQKDQITGLQATVDRLQATVDRLQASLDKEVLRASEVKGKLESSGQLLLKLHEQLDQLLVSQEPEAGEVAPRIAAWVESDELTAV
ncbi:MAG: hypothetical protein Q8938_14645 [Bacteroidota bacterium]|nr:hypothetical protein [Bacteroidota bacterium]